MKLTKKLEAEILKAYTEIWDAYLKGDMRTFASMLDENCYIIGSAAGEVFSNKKAAVKYYKSTAEQITGKAEFRNRKINVMPVEKGFMVNEGSDFYLLIDGRWTFYGPARISSLFHKKNNKWKVIHQHGSFPDSKTEEGEQVNADKIKAENIQLRDAVKRRTEELENKNHELEIETSLEKVRTVAMGMRKPEDFPDVCEVLFKELQSLGFKELRNAMVNIHNDEKRSFVNYDYSDEIGKSITSLSYNEHPVIKKQTLSFYPYDYNSNFQYVDIVKGADTIRVFNHHLQSLKFSQGNLSYIENPSIESKQDLEKSKNVIAKFKAAFLKRKVQADHIRAEIEKSPYPVIVCGDMNDVPNSYAYQTIGNNLKNAFEEKGAGLGRTFTGIAPTLRIDNIFMSKTFTVNQFVRIDKKLSDHFPIIADIGIEK